RRLRDVRRLLLTYRLLSVLDLGENVFEEVIAPSCVFALETVLPSSEASVFLADLSAADPDEKSHLLHSDSHRQVVKQEIFARNTDFDFAILSKEYTVPVFKLGQFDQLECKDAGINYQRVNVGMQAKGNSDLGARLLYEGEQKRTTDEMYWKGSDINRYWIADSTGRFCRTHYHEFIQPNEVVHLNREVFDTHPKILLRQTADSIIATMDNIGVWFGRSLIAIVPRRGKLSNYRLEYVLGLLNSKYIHWLYQKFAGETGRVFAQVKLSKLKQLPIRKIDFSDPNQVAIHDRVVRYVEGLADLHKQCYGLPNTEERRDIERQIAAADRALDGLVYELYGLSEAEIAIVEGRA
ncbi:MAG: hypothetical protein L0220_00165, partial [Acidobacteria bacterium]|nr:hypothetical protein [Acidobacteriota bacterium]